MSIVDLGSECGADRRGGIACLGLATKTFCDIPGPCRNRRSTELAHLADRQGKAHVAKWLAEV